MSPRAHEWNVNSVHAPLPGLAYKNACSDKLISSCDQEGLCAAWEMHAEDSRATMSLGSPVTMWLEHRHLPECQRTAALLSHCTSRLFW